MTVTIDIGSPVFEADIEVGPGNYYAVALRHADGYEAFALTDPDGRAAFSAVPIGLITWYCVTLDPEGTSLRTAWLRY